MADLRPVSEAVRCGQRITGLLFDKDGTLLDYHLSWRPINERAARFAAAGEEGLARRLLLAGGCDLESGRVRANSLLAAGTPRDIAEHWVAAGSPFPVQVLTRELDRIFCEGVANVVPVLDLAHFFARLAARGLALGIASSDSAAAILATAERFGFARHLDFIGGWDSGCGAKPGPGPLEAFCASTGRPASEVAVVGDNLHDMEMAQAGGAGLRVAVLTGTGTRATLATAADLCLDSIAGLEAALFGIE